MIKPFLRSTCDHLSRIFAVVVRLFSARLKPQIEGWFTHLTKPFGEWLGRAR
jgi:hypothetical protein